MEDRQWYEQQRMENREFWYNFTLLYQQNRIEDREFIYDLINGRHHNRLSEVASTLQKSSVSVSNAKRNNAGAGHFIYYGG